MALGARPEMQRREVSQAGSSGQFILDFVCFERRLVVEIDGPSHAVPAQRLADETRDAWLREQGFQILRLPNELVIASTELAVARIRDAMTN